MKSKGKLIVLKSITNCLNDKKSDADNIVIVQRERDLYFCWDYAARMQQKDKKGHTSKMFKFFMKLFFLNDMS